MTLMENERLELLGGDTKIIVSKNHSFGTDAVLLANFSMPKINETVCEFGTGCGIIPLLWSLNVNYKKAYAIDIQKEACDQAQRSVSINNLSEKIETLHADLRDLKGVLPYNSFDLVAMNPPYMALNKGLTSPNESIKIAKHEICCNINEISRSASLLLKQGGRFSICHKPERLCDIMIAMRNNNIEPKYLRFVAYRQNKDPWLALIEGRKSGNPGLKVAQTLVMENEDGSANEEVKRIYGFYGRDYL